MSLLDRALANSVSLIPRPIVKRISSRYIAGERTEEMIQTIRGLNHEGCVATVDVPGESMKNRAGVSAHPRCTPRAARLARTNVPE